MNHDITHCKGEGCMLRESCMRYQAHLEYHAHPEMVAAIGVPYCDENECLMTGQKLYWETYDLRANNAWVKDNGTQER